MVRLFCIRITRKQVQTILGKPNAKLIDKIKNFRLLDDDFMSKVFENDIECTELLLHIILEKPDLKVQDVQTQYSIKNLLGRSVRLDIHAIDSEQKKYNIEIQRADKGAGAKRARYNSSIIDANSLPAGKDFDELPETYVIFITEKKASHLYLWPFFSLSGCFTDIC